MKILLVHPGASMSTADVWSGLKLGLTAQGHMVFDYALDGRIERAGQYLAYCWKKGGKRVGKPSSADILYFASEQVVARALRVAPDVVLVVSAMFLHPDVFVLMRRAGLRVAVLLTESPYDDERQARLLPYVDVAWTNERVSARALGVHYLPHAWNPSVHRRTTLAPDPTPSYDVVFVGTGFKERCDLLSATDWSGINLGLYGSWDLLGSRNPLRQFIRGGYISNEEAARLYQRASIGLNLYRQSKGFGPSAPRVTHAESLNPRAYELAALGCFTVSDDRAEVREVFGDLVPTIAGPDDLSSTLRRWLADPEGRRAVQQALPPRVAEHTWLQRAAVMTDHLVGAGIGARGETTGRRAVASAIA